MAINRTNCYRSLAAVCAIGLAACTSSSGDASTPPDGSGPSPIDTAPIDTAPIDTAPIDNVPIDTAPIDTAPIDTATEPTPTTTPSAALAVVSTTQLEDGSTQQRLDDLGDAVATADGASVIVVGSRAIRPGEPHRAVVHLGNGIDDFTEVALVDGDAEESYANAVAVAGPIVVIVGSVLGVDGLLVASAWTSTDSGSTFSTPTTVTDGPSRADDVTLWEDGVAVASIVESGPVRSISVSTSADSTTWDTVEIDVPGADPAIGGLVRLGDRLVLTVSFEVGGDRTAQAWTSDDDGASFTPHDDAVLTESSSIGAPSVLEGRLLVSVGQAGSLPTRLASSTDGVVWEPIALDVTRFDQPLSFASAATGPIVEFDGRYAFGTTDQLGSVALIDSTGSGSLQNAPYHLLDVYGRPIPIVVGGRLLAIGASNTSWRVGAYDAGSDSWSIVKGPEEVTRDHTASSVSLTPLLDGVAATTITYPHVRSTSDNGVRWGTEERWTIDSGDAEWSLTTTDQVPSDTMQIVTNDSLELAVIEERFDPGDDDLAGPTGGTSVALRERGGTWTQADELLLTGPGGDFASDATSTETGFLLVGGRYVRDEAGVSTSTAVLAEYSEGVWSDLTIGSDLGDRAELTSVAETTAGIRVATGTYFDGERFVPMVLSPDTDGAWTLAELPGATPELDVVDVLASGDAIDLVARDGQSWILYSTTDGRSFEATPLDFDGQRVSLNSGAVVDGTTVLVGSVDTLGASTPAAWRFTDAGIERIELPDAPSQVGLRVTDTLATNDGRLLVGVVSRDQSLVVDIEFP